MVTHLFADELSYQPFSFGSNSFESPMEFYSANNFQHDLLPSEQFFFSANNNLFSNFLLPNNGLMLASTVPGDLEPGLRPGDNGAYGAIGHIPAGDGISILILILLGYAIFRRWRIESIMTNPKGNSTN